MENFFNNPDIVMAEVEETEVNLKKKKLMLMMIAATVIAVVQAIMVFPGFGFVSTESPSRSLLQISEDDEDAVNRALHTLINSMTRALGKITNGCKPDSDESYDAEEEGDDLLQ